MTGSSVSAHALHWFTRAALRLFPPQRAKRTVDRVARWLPRRSVAEALRDAATIGTQGSCLSRAVALAARTPGADVVIGVNPRLSSRLYAHAWVEVGGVCVALGDERHFAEEIARLKNPATD